MMSDDDDYEETGRIQIPWGRYTYALEGLAGGCYLEGGSKDSIGRRRLRFRVELPTRCFVMSVALKLSNGQALDDVTVERTINSADFDVIHEGAECSNSGDAASEQNPLGDSDESDEEEEDEEEEDDGDDDEFEDEEDADDDAGEEEDDVNGELAEKRERQRRRKARREKAARRAKKLARAKAKEAADPTKKLVELRRAADALRLTLTDLEDDEVEAAGGSSGGGGGVRVLTVSVLGYTRGQTPPSKVMKVLLNVTNKLIVSGSLGDQAEADGLLGLACLGNRRYRQAAEFLRRAADLNERVADEDRKLGFSSNPSRMWAAQLNLLAAHAFFEHVPLSNDGVAALLLVASASDPVAGRSPGSSFTNDGSRNNSPRDIKNPALEFLDLRTELLSTMEPLIRMLVLFLGESQSLAVRMASARMIEFVANQLGCAISPYMASVLNQVLRSYEHCKPFGARERPAANSFSYDSMEDCYERLIDTCCKMIPITEHTILQKLFDHTVVPIFQEAFKESDYLFHEEGVEESCNELLCTAIAQTLRVSYLVLSVLEGDAHVPSSFVARVLNMLISENGIRRTPTLLRRTALHTWDAVCKALTLGASGVNVKEFKEFLVVEKEYIGRLIVQMDRPSFEYSEAEDTENGIEVFKKNCAYPEESDALRKVAEKAAERTVVVDRFTLKRLLDLIKRTCESLQSCNEDDAMLTAAYVVFDLQRRLAAATADLLLSALVDVSYDEACVSGNGEEAKNIQFETSNVQKHIKHICEIIELLLECFWGAVSLLPSNMASEAEQSSPVRPVLAWCVYRMQYSAPPPGMLLLLNSTCKGLKSDMNKSMHAVSSPTLLFEGEVTFLQIYRAHLTWLPQTTNAEALELTDTLTEIAGPDLMAPDVARTVDALCDQTQELDSRADTSLGRFAVIVAEMAPRKEALAEASLRELVDPKQVDQQILVGFPKSAIANSSFRGRMRFTPAAGAGANSMMRSFYMHVVLASCFDKFSNLNRLAERQGGPSFMSEKLDAFVEHAVFLVKTLNAGARLRHHREYISSSFGNLFRSCLTMQDHVDGRVRLSGFEIFAGALDVLFVAQKQSGQAASANHGAEAVTSVPGAPVSGGGEGAPGVSELPAITVISSVTELGADDEDGESSVTQVNPVSSTLTTNGSLGGSGEPEEGEPGGTQDKAVEFEAAFADGGPCVFRADSTPASRLTFEDKGWQMLCMFMTSSLGVGKYVDFVVQRACLEYLKSCLLNSMRGQSSGANVLSLQHVSQLWDSVLRIVGSPWRTLNGLSCWVSCVLVNAGFFATVTAKGKQAKVRSSQLEDFAVNQLFPVAEKFIRGETRETRLWGVRLLEVYLRAREMNQLAFDLSPPPKPRIMRQMDMLCHDWSTEVRDLAKVLRDLYIDSSLQAKSKSSAGGPQSFTQSSLTAMKRQLYRDSGGPEGDVISGALKVELWFPPLPKATSAEQSEMFGRTLEAFANTEVAGGEESADEDDDEGMEYYDDGEYDEDGQEEEEEEAEDFDTDEVGEDEEDEQESNEEVGLEADDTVDHSDDDTVEDGVTEANNNEESTNLETPSLVLPTAREDEDEDEDAVVLEKKKSGEQPSAGDNASVNPPVEIDPDFVPEDTANDDDVAVVSSEDELLADLDSTPSVPEKVKSMSSIDLEEKMPGSARLRRKGSFTGPSRTPVASTMSGEGQTPPLTRRRSSEVAGFEGTPASKDAAVAAAAAIRRRSTDDRRVGEEVTPASVSRRRQSAMKLPLLAAMFSEGGAGAGAGTSPSGDGDASTAGTAGRPKIDRETAIGSTLLSLSPRRVSRGVNLDDDGEPSPTQNRSSSARDPSSAQSKHTPTRDPPSAHSRLSSTSAKEGRPKAASFSGVSGDEPTSSGGSSGRPKPRRLPRAPAFVKGDARLPRADSNPGVSRSSGSMGGSPSSRPRVPRTKGNKSMRLVPNSPGTTELGTGRRVDRSNRFGKRDVNLKLEDDGLGLDDDDDDDDILGSFDPTLVEEDIGEGKGVHSGRVATPKGNVRRSLVDDEAPRGEPVAPKKRSAQRILDSVAMYSRANSQEDQPNGE